MNATCSKGRCNRFRSGGADGTGCGGGLEGSGRLADARTISVAAVESFAALAASPDWEIAIAPAIGRVLPGNF